MLVGTPAGSCYNEAEYAGWMQNAGFSDVRRVRLPGPAGFMIGNTRLKTFCFPPSVCKVAEVTSRARCPSKHEALEVTQIASEAVLSAVPKACPQK